MKHNVPRPPLARGFPLAGNLFSLLDNPHRFVQSSYERYGQVFRFRALHREYVVMAGVEANRFVSGEGKDLLCVDGFWGEAAKVMGSPNMLIAVDGDVHRYQRSAMMPLFGQNAFKERVQELADPSLELIRQQQPGRAIDVGALLRCMVSHQIGHNLQGYRSSHQTVEQMIYYFGSVMNVYGLRKWPRFMLHAPKVRYAKRVTDRHIQQTLAAATQRSEEQKQRNPLYLDTMIPLLQERPDWFGKGDIRLHALLPFVAALDTVASTMGFLLLRLLQDNALAFRLQREVDQVFADGLPTLSMLRSMKDLNGAVKETLRLQPTAFGITRTATQDFDFNGYRIQRGDDVMVFTTADHLNSRYFPNPECFDIERYRAPRNEHKQPAYAPFGKGPHNCIGASLAEILLPLNLGLMLYHWRIAPACDVNQVKLRFNPAPVLDKSFRIKVTYRNRDNRIHGNE